MGYPMGPKLQAWFASQPDVARGGPCEGHERRSLRASAPIATRRHGEAVAEWCSYGRTEAADRTYEFTRSTDRQAMVMYACMHVFPDVRVCATRFHT